MSQDRDREALEAQVAELAANVDGLTNELVDAKERIRELEVELGIREGGADREESKTVEELFEEADADPIAEQENGEEPDQETIGDDIILG